MDEPKPPIQKKSAKCVGWGLANIPGSRWPASFARDAKTRSADDVLRTQLVKLRNDQSKRVCFGRFVLWDARLPKLLTVVGHTTRPG